MMAQDVFSHIFYFGTAYEERGLHLNLKGDLPDDVRTAIAAGEHKPTSPLEFVYHSGSVPLDFIGETLADFDLVSPKVIEVLRRERITGWSTYPVRAYDKRGRLVEGYEGLAITGRCGPVDDSKSRLEHRRSPGARKMVIEVMVGLYFDPDTWDGSDLFMEDGRGHTFATEKVKVTFEAAGLTNCSFERASEAENVAAKPPRKPPPKLP